MTVHLALLQTVSVPTLTESVKSVQQIGFAQTIALILLLLVVTVIGIVGWSIRNAMISIVRDSAANATAQALTVTGQTRIENGQEKILESSQRIEANLQRLIDRRDR